MMRLRRTGLMLMILLQACAGGNHLRPTIADLAAQQAIPDRSEIVAQVNPQVQFHIDREQVIKSYRDLVAITTPGKGNGKELQRLANLELEDSMDTRQSEQQSLAKKGSELTRLAIERYEQYLKNYPRRVNNDRILYQLARAYAIDGKPQRAQDRMDQLVAQYPASRYRDEVQFRRGENLFVEKRYPAAESAYRDVVEHHPNSLYFDKALYKLGWSQFKQNHYRPALDSFIRLLDLKQRQGQIQTNRLASNLGRGERELLQDVLRVVSLAFSYLPARQPIAAYFDHSNGRQYEPLLYRNLAQLYLSKDRISDATDVYLSYGKKYPFSPYAAVFHQRAIVANKKAGFSNLLLAEKKNFVKQYNRGTQYWQRQTPATQAKLQALLTQHIFDIATYYHALARASKKPHDFKTAADWYRRYLQAFPRDKRAAEVNFLLAESLFDAQQFQQAIAQYEKTAYQYPPHRYSAEAGYAAILAYDRLLKHTDPSKRADLEQRAITSILKFGKAFPQDNRRPKVLLTTAQKLFDNKQYEKARQLAIDLLNIRSSDKSILRGGWNVLAHAELELKMYSSAEASLKILQQYIPRKEKKLLHKYREEQALSVYRQGEAARAANNHPQAAQDFLRASKIAPATHTALIAAYDAATEFIAEKDWLRAIRLLQGIRKHYPGQNKWRLGISQKLALAYNNSGQYPKAAAEMLTLSQLSPRKDRRDLLWQSAQLYEQSGQTQKAIALYKQYIKQYPRPLARSIELRNRIAQYYRKKNDTRHYYYWLKEIVKADGRAKKQRSDRSRYLAAHASLALIKPVRQKYAATRLIRPLKKSLKRKKILMKRAIAAYSKAARYQVEDVTTAATFNIAEIYREFADALLKSERPKKLDADALEEYNFMLEDQAYPFEEKAIKIHQSNLSRIARGSYDESIKKSLAALAKLMPFRYAKSEIIDTYVE